MPVQNICLQAANYLHVCGVPAVEVLPYTRVERLEVKVLEQIGPESLAVALGDVRVEQA